MNFSGWNFYETLGTSKLTGLKLVTIYSQPQRFSNLKSVGHHLGTKGKKMWWIRGPISRWFDWFHRESMTDGVHGYSMPASFGKEIWWERSHRDQKGQTLFAFFSPIAAHMVKATKTKPGVLPVPAIALNCLSSGSKNGEPNKHRSISLVSTGNKSNMTVYTCNASGQVKTRTTRRE